MPSWDSSLDYGTPEAMIIMLLLPSWNLLTTLTHSNQNRSQSKIKHKSTFIEVLIILKKPNTLKKNQLYCNYVWRIFQCGLGWVRPLKKKVQQILQFLGKFASVLLLWTLYRIVLKIRVVILFFFLQCFILYWSIAD